MKHIQFCLLIFVTLGHTQDQFKITAEGLTPKFTIVKIDAIEQNELYQKSLAWATDNSTDYKISIEEQVDNEYLKISFVKSNGVSNKYKQYFHVKYSIALSFKYGELYFKPIAIQLKQNSKYDLGWNDFDLYDGSEFVKKGKIKRDHKSYIKNLMDPLNEFCAKLTSAPD